MLTVVPQKGISSAAAPFQPGQQKCLDTQSRACAWPMCQSVSWIALEVTQIITQDLPWCEGTRVSSFAPTIQFNAGNIPQAKSRHRASLRGSPAAKKNSTKKGNRRGYKLWEQKVQQLITSGPHVAWKAQRTGAQRWRAQNRCRTGRTLLS
jgi:hypothetical protein